LTEKFERGEFDDEYADLLDRCKIPLVSSKGLEGEPQDLEKMALVKIKRLLDQGASEGTPNVHLVYEVEQWFNDPVETGKKELLIEHLDTEIEPYKEVCNISEDELKGDISDERAVEIGLCIVDNIDSEHTNYSKIIKEKEGD
jgi:hypothetical protein